MAQDIENWKLAERIAWLNVGAASARVDLVRPHLGLQELHLASRSIDGQLLALAPSEAATTWPARLADAYVRGPDLVATYTGDIDWPYAPQVYWNAEPTDSRSEIVAALTLVVSIQTNLLDTHPQLDVRSSLGAEEVLLLTLAGDELLVDSHADSVPDGIQRIDPRATACSILWRLPGDTLSYAEVMPTSDCRQLSVQPRSTGECQSRWQLFAEFLEKGVIRRARLQSLWVPRANDVQLVAECCRAIESRPLPLTT